MSWQPSASLDAVKARAKLNRLIRAFFASREVLEVETPLLCRTTATDPHLRSFAVALDRGTGYLQTSPEFCMKRLLAAGSGPIYQLCKAFRHESGGRYHNPEFTLLEWYRPGWTLAQLVDEVEALVRFVSEAFAVEMASISRFTYQQVFKDILGIDPHSATDAELLHCAMQSINGNFADLDRNGLLDLLMSHLVEPALPRAGAFVADFPAGQAALSRKKCMPDGHWVAQRVELYIGGMEIANAYQELVEAGEQEERFMADLSYRKRHGLAELPFPLELMGALQFGLPESAGVALGVDRLLMVLKNEGTINSVTSFPHHRA